MATSNKPRKLKRLISMFDISERVANGIYDWSNVPLLVAAALVLVGTFGAVWSGGVRDKYNALRDAAHEEKIAAAKKESAEANASAAVANQAAGEANREAAKANEGLAEATLDIEQSKAENLKLQLQVEAEKQKRVALEGLLRRRNFNPFDNRQDMLHPHKGTKVILENVRGEEAEGAAKSIADLLAYCRWDVVSWHFTDEKPTSGIFVWANKQPLSDTDKSGDAQKAMVAYLESKGFKTGAMPAWESKPLPENTVRIVVGPSEMFEDKPPIRFSYPDHKILADGPQEPPKESAKPESP
jgi:hypothetical protein